MGKLIAQCPNCSGKFKASPKHVGKKVKCPKCGTAIEIPEPPEEEESFGFDLESDESEEPEGPKETGKTCPNCGETMGPDDVICVSCGWNLQTGEQMPQETQKAEDSSRSFTYLNVIKKYAVFSGRATRKEYFIFMLCHFIISFLLWFLPMAVLPFAESLGSTGAIIAGIIAVSIPVLYQFALIIPALAVTVRRLHDTDRSGWWVLISLVPFVGPIILLVFLIMDSTPGENSYGPNPKETETTA